MEPKKIAKAPEGEGCPRCGGYVYAAEQMLARGRVSFSFWWCIWKTYNILKPQKYKTYNDDRVITGDVSNVYSATVHWTQPCTVMVPTEKSIAEVLNVHYYYYLRKKTSLNNLSSSFNVKYLIIILNMMWKYDWPSSFRASLTYGDKTCVLLLKHYFRFLKFIVIMPVS